jgi:hypothetical protein
MAEVTIGPGFYLVVLPDPGKGLDTAIVYKKDQACSCGGVRHNGQRCEHIEAIERYLKRGGKPAPEEQRDSLVPRLPPLLQKCPVCSGVIDWEKKPGVRLMWRCREDSAHYWDHRTREIEPFLTGKARKTGIPAINGMPEGEYAKYLDRLEEEKREQTVDEG